MLAALQVEDVSKYFGEFQALSHVNLEVANRSRHAVIGPNGAGKSTLFAAISGILPIDDGRIVIGGSDVTSLSVVQRTRAGLGRSFQITSVFPDFTVLENAQFAVMCRNRTTRRLAGRADRAFRSQAKELLDLVGLGDRQGVIAGTLSHGEQRALELALAVAPQPRTLLLDEPTAGMAVAETAAAMELIDRIAGELSLTLVFTEHDMDVVFSVAERITVMAHGHVIAEGTPDEMRASPAVKEVYLGG